MIVISEDLTKEGLKTGRININHSPEATDNIISVYCIFDRDFDHDVTVKVFDEADREYGRMKQNIKGSKGEARYIDFVFDTRTNIDGRGKISFE